MNTLPDQPDPGEVIASALAEMLAHRPSDAYVPGVPKRFPNEADRYQLQFHRSLHTVRCLVLGNGAGKTTVAGIECDWWCQGDHPHQVGIPKGPKQIVWVCMKFQQMKLLREQLERKCFTRGWKYNENDHEYKWPNGSTITIFSNDGDWEGIQGLNPDLVVIDEECDPRLWRELTMRRRGDKKTRFVISATATKGKRWMFSDLYKPWLDHHTAQGMTEDQAMRVQNHRDYWVWPKGGLLDNPANSEEDLRWYETALAFASPQEKQARLRGGFIDLSQSPVFDLASIDVIDVRAKAAGLRPIVGVLEPVTNPASRRRPNQVVEYQFIPNGSEHDGGTITLWEPPVDATYVIGADFAHGLQTGDFDSAIVLRKGEGNQIHQVAEAHGHWGTLSFTWVLYALGWFYNEALICGEANSMGLGVLQRLYTELGYTYQYFREAKPDARNSPKTDRLGFFKTHDSKLIPRLQWVISPVNMDTGLKTEPLIHVHSAPILEELRRYERKPRNKTAELLGTRDTDLVMAAESGHHDDRVSALAAAVTGWIELPRFVKPEKVFERGSLGDVLGHDKILNPKKSNRTAPSLSPRNDF